MTEPQRKRPRVTPRNSNVEDAAVDKGTPYADLRQLAGIIQKPHTPFQPIASLFAPQTSKRTPATVSQTPRAPATLRQAPKRVGPPTTPHAIRALQQRRAVAVAGTPGLSRRRSGRQQRETPRDTLRNLSKLLAPKTQPIDRSLQASQQVGARRSQLDDKDWEDEPDIPVPRLSIPLNDQDEDDDSFYEQPPRMSTRLDDDEQTGRSFEAPRRALPGQSRLSRGSYGSVRLSDRFADLNDLGVDAMSDAEDTARPYLDEEDDLPYDDDDEDAVVSEEAQDLRSFTDVAAKMVSRKSELALAALEESEHDPTFRFVIPERARKPSIALGVEEEPKDDAPLEAEELEADDDALPAYGDLPNAEGEKDDEAAEADDIFEDVYENAHADLDYTAIPTSPRTAAGDSALKGPTKHKRPEQKLSRHGHPYPSLPSSVIKRLSTTLARSVAGGSKLNKDMLAAISQASDWFFEQVAEDLGRYAEHAGRRTIEEGDVVLLMGRQRQLTATTTPFSLAQRYLPRELMQEIRMPPVSKMKGRGKRKRPLDVIQEENEDLADEQ
ncbi:hypothetical protein B0A49_03122 [Cryomyces minteri]|uniref:CENP-T/Histone H4 histone fold domain-containing protein n=1 Tax=Cryomyces minteri TaxID=331657 RepID=A0A4U0X7Q0_9PEZI|nr:hypothetical protein B0A49_03122 [Cryomyces minteri]